jgi:hypothetical protein
MNIFLRELTIRLISYLVRVSKGDTYEEKQEHLLKKTLLFALMALIMAATMTSKYLVTGWYMNDLEKSVAKIDTFMGTQQENMNQLFRINTDQYTEIQRLAKENIEVRSDIRLVLDANSKLSRENQELRQKLEKKK